MRARRKGAEGTASPEKRGTTSRARVLARTSATEKDPLLRPHYIVYLSSKQPLFLALLLPPSSSPPSLSSLLALRLLVSRNKQLPFSLTYKADLLRTCPSRRMTVNRSRGDHRDVLPADRGKKRWGGLVCRDDATEREPIEVFVRVLLVLLDSSKQYLI